MECFDCLNIQMINNIKGSYQYKHKFVHYEESIILELFTPNIMVSSSFVTSRILCWRSGILSIIFPSFL